VVKLVNSDLSEKELEQGSLFFFFACLRSKRNVYYYSPRGSSCFIDQGVGAGRRVEDFETRSRVMTLRYFWGCPSVAGRVQYAPSSEKQAFVV